MRAPRASRWEVAAWTAVALIFTARLIAALRIPLTGDEAYYWEWSLRPAGAYYDHPGGVAWVIALFDHGPRNVALVRLGFLACGAGATLWLADFAAQIAHDRRAAAAAALLLNLAPLLTIGVAVASPDAPYLLCWCAALALGKRAFDRGSWWWGGFGLAVAGAVESRLLGFALVLAVLLAVWGELRLRRRLAGGWWMAPVAFAAGCVPLVAWNAAHEWVTLTFALVGRHVDEGLSAGRVIGYLLLAALVLGPGCAVAALWAAVQARRARTAWGRLAFWSALPTFAVIVLLGAFERVEVYWLYGPYVALIGVAAALAVKLPWRRAAWVWVIVPSAILLTPLLLAASAPSLTVAASIHALGHRLRNNGPFEIFTYPALAHDVAAEAARSAATVATDGYGLSSLLDFYGGVPPVVIGYDRQGRQARTWFDHDASPREILFVDKEPLSTRPDFAARFARACARVEDDGLRLYDYEGVPARAYYLTKCLEPRRGALRILLWQE
ncbi:MAG: glycosyltransferase family 39 protein [bacterium]|nr:glycosyltransferase family 39 protein [bacterium]